MAKSPDNTQLWQFLRAKIEHEDQWIQQRVSWNLAATTFLVGGYAALAGSTRMPHQFVPGSSLLLAIIPLAGLAFSLLVLSGLFAASIATDAAKAYWKAKASNQQTRDAFPELHSSGAALTLGRIASWGTTIICALVWFALVVASIGLPRFYFWWWHSW